MDRRQFIRTGLGGMAAIAAGKLLDNAINGGEVYAAEAGKPIKEFKLSAGIAEIDIGSKFKAWTYNGQAPGPEIRVKENEVLRVILKNSLPEPTTIHWHGLPVPNAMDGVPDITQKPIQPGETFFTNLQRAPPGAICIIPMLGISLIRVYMARSSSNLSGSRYPMIESIRLS
jgi:FtsP/CotA-like multicopper oxidase with cupredoxin domain